MESRDGKRFEMSAVNDSEKASSDNRRSQKTCSGSLKIQIRLVASKRGKGRRKARQTCRSHTTWHLLYGVGFDRARIEIKTKERRRQEKKRRKKSFGCSVKGSAECRRHLLARSGGLVSFSPSHFGYIRSFTLPQHTTPTNQHTSYTRWCAPPPPPPLSFFISLHLLSADD